MKLYEYQRSRSFIDLDPNHSDSIFLNIFSSITADFNISAALRWAIQNQWSSGLGINWVGWLEHLAVSFRMLRCWWHLHQWRHSQSCSLFILGFLPSGMVTSYQQAPCWLRTQHWKVRCWPAWTQRTVGTLPELWSYWLTSSHTVTQHLTPGKRTQL